MKYKLKAFYQPYNAIPFKKVEIDKLSNYIGLTLADMIIIKAEDRMAEKTMPEVIAFFEHGGRQIIVSSLTNRGNVSIEAVEIAE